MNDSPVFERIKTDIDASPLVLYMKGTPTWPQCGFSSAVVQILNNLGIEFKGIDVLVDQELREGIKKFTNWPTIPQLYIKGEFVGGCDIIRTMHDNGELEALLKEKGIPFKSSLKKVSL